MSESTPPPIIPPGKPADPVPVPVDEPVTAERHEHEAQAEAKPHWDSLKHELAPHPHDGRIDALEGLVQQLVDFFHWMYPGHPVPGRPSNAPDEGARP